MSAILLVDDDAKLRLMIERTLTAQRHTVTEAPNGVEALKLLDTTTFDLVITDVVMPDMEGLQLLREIRAKKLKVKVIAMSGGGYGSASDYLTLAATFGAVATLPKPFTHQQLLDAVAGALGEQSPG